MTGRELLEHLEGLDEESLSLSIEALEVNRRDGEGVEVDSWPTPAIEVRWSRG